MKTLNEVIETAPYVGTEWTNNALHYLQAYRDDKDDLTALRAYWKEQHENNALTWDELKQMEGKPVWVEGSHGCIWGQKSWALIKFIHDGDMLCLIIEPMVGEFCISEEDYGTDWQAYRKERHER